MKKIISNFCDNEDNKNGLFLLDMPTGFGKTYSVIEYIYDAALNEKNSYKKIFFITTLKKNLPITELRTRFEKDDKIKDFNEKFLFIDSNADCVIENLSLDLINNIPEFIKESKEYKDLEENIKFINQKSKDKSVDVKNIITKIKEDIRIKNEPIFRKYISSIICKKFQNVEARLNAVKMNPEWKWLGQLYPAVFTRNKQIIFMSMEKFVTRNSTIIEPSYMFYNSDIIEDAIIFVDEFDATKETILNNIIKNGLRDRIDFLELFKYIYAALQIKEFPEALTTPSQRRKNDFKYSKQSLQSIIDSFREKADILHQNYYLQFSHRTEEDEESISQNFLFQDHLFHSILKDDKKGIEIKHDNKKRINHIEFTNKKFSNEKNNIFVMLGGLRGFITFFIRGVNVLAINYMQLKQEDIKTNGYEFSREAAIRSVLSEFRLGKYYIDYLTSIILTTQHSNEIMIYQNYDLSFYEKGFRYFSFENDYFHDMQSKIMMCAFQNTPEKILLKFCEKAKVVGISATATIPSVVGNYDIEYIKSRLQKSFYILNEKEQIFLKKQFEKHTRGYENTDIVIKFLNSGDLGGYSISSWKQVFEDSDLAMYIYNKIEQKQSIDTNNYNKERYVRIALSYKQFIINKDIQSFLCMLTKHPRKNNENLDIELLYEIFKFIVEENKEYCPIGFEARESVIQLDGEEYNDKKEEIIKKLTEGKKIFVISVYQTIGAGQNIQYGIPEMGKDKLIKINDFEGRYEKDFDAIYLDKPTNVLVNLENKLSEENFVKYIFQIEFLQENAEISAENSISYITKAFNCFSTQVKFNDYNPDLYNKKSVALLSTRIIIQAIGRICRTNIKKNKIYIFADERIKSCVDTSVGNGRLLNPEFEKLLEHINGDSKKDFVDSSLEDAGSLVSVRVNTFINNMLRDKWTDKSIQKWKYLRDISLKYPTLSKETLEKNPIFRNFYIRQPSISSKLFYNQENDYSNVKISFTLSNDFPFQVSEKSARLETLMQLPEVFNFFKMQGFATSFVENDYIQSPALFNNIYKGALGEVVGSLLFNKLIGISLEEIEDTDIFELFDFKVKNKPIYVDFKNWNEITRINREDMINKIVSKMETCKAECALIVNIIAKNEFEIRRSKIKEKLIIEIPYLYKINPLQLNEKAIDEIRRCINDFSN